MHACPVNCNPQEFINHAKQGAYGEAVKTITRTNPMGQTCGLICPDKFCMQACTRSRIDFAVNIPKVQATILENFRNDGEDYSQTKPKTLPSSAPARRELPPPRCWQNQDTKLTSLKREIRSAAR